MQSTEKETDARYFISLEEEREWVEQFVSLWAGVDAPTIESRVRHSLGPVLVALAAERDRADRAEARIADAWDEGYVAVPAEPEDRQFFIEDAPNPYRSEATA